MSVAKPKRKAGGPSGKPGPRSGRSPHKRVQDWIKDAADRAEGIAEPSEPILDREDREKGKSYGLSLETVRTTHKRVAEVASGLPELNPKHLAFVEAMVTGKASTPSEAYCMVYGDKHATRVSLWHKASMLVSNPKIQEWMAAYRMAALDDIMTTADRHVAQLARIRELAIAKGDLKAAGIAEVSRGKVAGLYEDRVVIEHRAGDDALIEALTRTLGAETAAQLATALGSKALPGDKARPIMLDATIGDSPVTVTAGEDDKDED